MNRDLLSKAFGDIDDRFVAEAYRQPDSEDPSAASERIVRMKKKRIITFALIAAIILALGAAAYAGVTESWLSSFYSERQGKALTPRQEEYLETESIEITQSATVDGYTVTVESAVCDRMALCLVVRIEGPDGVKIDLDNQQGEGNLWFSRIGFESLGSYERTGYVLGITTYGRRLPDGDGKDNTTRLVLTTQRELTADSNQGFTDGELWHVRFRELFTRTGKYYENKTVLSDGVWDFTFPLTEQSEELEIITSPVACKALSGGEGKPKDTVDVEVTSFVIRTLGANCEYRLLSGEQARSVELSDVRLIMKNGDTVSLMPRSGGSLPDGFSMFYEFAAPILFDEIESLVLPENVIVPVG